MASLLNFRLEVVSLGCTVTSPLLYRYVANTFTCIGLTLCMVVLHVLHLVLFHFGTLQRSGIRHFRQVLLGLVRTVLISVWVICRSIEGEHRQMLIVGAVAGLIPLAFLLHVCLCHHRVAEAITGRRHCL